MDTAPAKFDWNGWLASIPGIPSDWGLAPARPDPVAAEPIDRTTIRRRSTAMDPIVCERIAA